MGGGERAAGAGRKVRRGSVAINRDERRTRGQARVAAAVANARDGSERYAWEVAELAATGPRQVVRRPCGAVSAGVAVAGSLVALTS